MLEAGESRVRDKGGEGRPVAPPEPLRSVRRCCWQLGRGCRDPSHLTMEGAHPTHSVPIHAAGLRNPLEATPGGRYDCGPWRAPQKLKRGVTDPAGGSPHHWRATMEETEHWSRVLQDGKGTSQGPTLEGIRRLIREGLPGDAEADEDAREAWLVRAIRQIRFPAGTPRHCLRCGSSETIRWGRFKSRQRYKCRSCARTFSDLTGTPFAHLKRLGLWLHFGECMALGNSVRKSARKVGVDKDTAFRWRHRLATALDRPRADEMRGTWAVWDTILPHSYKGRRPPDRGSRRKRGRLLDPLRPLHVHVLFLCSEHDPTWEFVTVRSKKIYPTDEELEEKLGPLLASHAGLIVPLHQCRTFAALAYTHRLELFDPIGRRKSSWALLNRGRRGRIRARMRSLERSPDGETPDPAGSAGEGLPEETAWALHSRAWQLRQIWRSWMRRFRGVASRYLRSYLAWYRQLLRAMQAVPDSRPAVSIPGPLEIPGRGARLASEEETLVPPSRLPAAWAGSVGLDLLLAGVRG